jgi:hypothetical protein
MRTTGDRMDVDDERRPTPPPEQVPTAAPPVPPAKRAGVPRLLTVVGWAAAALFGIWLLGTSFSGDSAAATDSVTGILASHDALPPRRDADAQAFVDLASSDPAAALAQCTVSRAAKTAITASFPDPSLTLDTVYATEFSGLTYYGANVIRPDGQRESSADVWVTDGSEGGLAAVSGSARVLSNLPDGRSKYGVSAGEGPVLRAQGCSIARLLSH